MDGVKVFKGLTQVLFFTSCFVQSSMGLTRSSKGSVPKKQEFCLLPEIAHAVATGAIEFKPTTMKQGFKACDEPLPTRYRTLDGTCNNVLNLGSANRPVRRCLPSAYEDGVDEPRSYGLPPATDVSASIYPEYNVASYFTVMLMQWGQFIDHDMNGFPISAALDKTIKCCGKDGEPLNGPLHRECFPIKMGPNKRFVGKCMEMARSVAATDEEGYQIYPREQMNEVTAFLDGSIIYGSSEDVFNRLREVGSLSHLMRMSHGDLLPPNPYAQEPCVHPKGEFCFIAGDSRVNEHPGLAAMHTVFVRLHNHIAKRLKSLNAGAKKETIFQETRKIVIAIVQNIHYGEWLPLILGRKAMKRYSLVTGHRSKFIPSVDPRICNVFATAVFRFGHSLIPSGLKINDSVVPFRKLFNKPHHVFVSLRDVVRSLTNPLKEYGAQNMDRFFTHDVTVHLFEPAEKRGKGDRSHGLDLVALNIQRGRDHGLPSYNHFRLFCGLPALKSFNELPAEVAHAMRKLYISVDDIDVFVGMMTEESEKRGQMVGPTFSCLLATQFHALKYGDRFFFETDRRMEGFAKDQLQAIRQVKMSHVFCVTTPDLQSVPKNAFRIVSKKNPDLSCSELKESFLDLSLWDISY